MGEDGRYGPVDPGPAAWYLSQDVLYCNPCEGSGNLRKGDVAGPRDGAA